MNIFGASVSNAKDKGGSVEDPFRLMLVPLYDHCNQDEAEIYTRNLKS